MTHLSRYSPFFALSFALWLTACASAAPDSAIQAATTTPEIVPASSKATASPRDLKRFKDEVRTAALNAGVSRQTIDLSLANFLPDPRVIKLDKKQPEKTQSFAQYYEHTATDGRITKGQSLLTQNHDLLTRIESDYGVPPSILVSLWGMESSYGSIMGNYQIIPSLATLAYEGRRHDFFESELIKAMQIVDAGDVSIDGMTGSWAGAMGQVQFMPSTFQSYAIDYTSSGHRDIWHNNADALASAANYLSKIGWHRGELWGREVQIPVGIDTNLAGLDKTKPLSEWRRMGITCSDGTQLPEANIDASLVLPDGPSGRAFLAYPNYKVIMKWNHSTYFATTVGLISDAIDGRE